MAQIHWNYFLAIEDALENLSRYIEFNSGNFGTYSIENAKILMTASQEADVLLKAICRLCSDKSDEVNGYQVFMQTNYPKLFDAKVFIPRYSLEFIPFKGWTTAAAPIWWTANNKVKHHRDTDFHRASLENTINAVAALLLLNIYYHVIIGGNSAFDPEKEPKLLKPEKDMVASRGHLLKFRYRIS
jgi:hypothetical protein